LAVSVGPQPPFSFLGVLFTQRLEVNAQLCGSRKFDEFWIPLWIHSLGWCSLILSWAIFCRASDLIG
jgi:hypothetical protein